MTAIEAIVYKIQGNIEKLIVCMYNTREEIYARIRPDDTKSKTECFYDRTIDGSNACDMISVDNVVDLEHVKNTAGQKMPILGNVAPVDYFIQGTKEEMEAAVKRCLQKAWDSPNGYILASGCDLSGQVKLENIEAFMNAARKYGKWPLDPKNFE